MTVDKTILDQVKAIAEKQFENQDSYYNIGFEFNGQFIVNPWMDESGRFELTTEEAIAKYGANAIHFFEDIIICNNL